MRTQLSWLLVVLALGGAWCAVPVYAQNWLSPDKTEATPYVFAAAGETKLGAEWSILNASSADEQKKELTYTVTDDAGSCFLDFSGTNPLAASQMAFLGLGISSASTDAAQQPLSLRPVDTGFLTTELCAVVRFEQSAAAPEYQELIALYPDVEHKDDGIFQGQLEGASNAVAPKVALYLDTTNHFCIGRVMYDETATTTDFEWVQTGVSYDDVGNGAVKVRVEYRTLVLDASADPDSTLSVDPGTMAYRVYVSKASPAPDETVEEKCLTTGLGYAWLSTPEEGYKIDFQATGDWLYAIDLAAIADRIGDGSLANLPSDTVLAARMQLTQLAFSAQGGGFQSAWLKQESAATLDDLNALGSLGRFDTYMKSDADLVQQWMLDCGVDLRDYVASPFARSAAPTYGLDKVFEDFLLYVDPEDGVEHRLYVTGLVPQENNAVTLTIRAPEGADLKKATEKAGVLCVTRAETLDALAAATPEKIAVGDLAFQDGSAIVTLTSPTPKPFMKVTLESKLDVK